MAGKAVLRRGLAVLCAAAVALAPFMGAAQTSAPTPPGEATTVAPVEVSGSATLNPLPVLSPAEWGEVAEKAYDASFDAGWTACDPYSTEARAQAWRAYAAQDAQAATRRTEELKAGGGAPEDIAAAEADRVRALRAYQANDLIAAEAHRRESGMLQAPIGEYANLRKEMNLPADVNIAKEMTRARMTQSGVTGVYVPFEYSDLRLSNVAARPMAVKGGEGLMRITGRIVNTRKVAITIPPLWFTLLDAGGQTLVSQQAQAPAFSGKIAAGAFRAFSFDYRPAPAAAVKVAATFAPMLRGRPERPQRDAMCGYGALERPHPNTRQQEDMRLGGMPPPNAPWISELAGAQTQAQLPWVFRMPVKGSLASSATVPCSPHCSHMVPDFLLVRGPDTPEWIAEPRWLRQPAPDDIRKAYPAAALRSRTSGQVTLSCVVRETGYLQNCAVNSQTPASLGFGAAAEGLSWLYMMRPVLPNGVQVTAAKVKLVIDFTAPSQQEARAAARAREAEWQAAAGPRMPSIPPPLALPR